MPGPRSARTEPIRFSSDTTFALASEPASSGMPLAGMFMAEIIRPSVARCRLRRVVEIANGPAGGPFGPSSENTESDRPRRCSARVYASPFFAFTSFSATRERTRGCIR